MFASDIRQWSTPDAFNTHLLNHDPALCAWVRFVVVHHTVKPTPDTWSGLRTMQSLQRYYMKLGWTSGPHLFICHGAKNARDDGIFQLTPLNMPGTHAGLCNSRTIGIEVVGYYDAQPWSAPLSDMVCTTIAHFMDWQQMPSSAIVGHRNCNSPKTCPGTSVSLPDVRSKVFVIRNNKY